MKYADQLRDAIDRGRTGDKVNWPDPAAAPLGTDEEAAGHAVPCSSVQMAAEQETARPLHPSPKEHGLGAAWYVVATALFIGASVMLGVFAR